MKKKADELLKHEKELSNSNDTTNILNEIDNIKNNHSLLSPFYYIEINIHEDWLINITKLNTVLNSSEMRQIYEIYDSLLICKSCLGDGYKNRERFGFPNIYNHITTKLCSQNPHNKSAVTYHKNHIKIMCKLEKLMNGVCRDVQPHNY